MENLSLILLNLGLALQATSGIDGVNNAELISTFNNTLKAINADNKQSVNTQTELTVNKENKIVENTKQKTVTVTETEKQKVNPDQKTKATLTVVTDVKTPVTTNKEDKETLTVEEAFKAIVKETRSILSFNKEKTVSSKAEASIITTTKIIYGKVLPLHENATDKGALMFYYNILMPLVVRDLKKEGVDIILPEEKKENTTKTVVAPIIPTIEPITEPVVNTVEPIVETVINAEIKTEPIAEVSVEDEVTQLMKAVETGAPVVVNIEKKEETKTTNIVEKTIEPIVETTIKKEELKEVTLSVTDTKTSISTNIENPDALASKIVEELKDVTPTAPGTISEAFKAKSKEIFANIYSADKGKKLEVAGKSYLFHDYMDNVAKIVKRLTGSLENSHLIKVGNTPQIKLIKDWTSEWSVKSA